MGSNFLNNVSFTNEWLRYSYCLTAGKYQNMKFKIVCFAFFFVSVFSSCKRDFVCTCTDQSGNKVPTDIQNETLLNARAKCKSMDYSSPGLGLSKTCSLN